MPASKYLGRYNRNNTPLTGTTKKCKTCGVVKRIEDFYTERSNKDGRRGTCKKCKPMEPNPYNRTVSRKHKLKSHYGITPEEFQELKNSQGGKCKICGREEFGVSGPHRTPRELAVDHDHKTGKIRGLLCHQCNAALGLLGDSTDIFIRCINYLNETIS